MSGVGTPVGIAEAKAYLRIANAEEDAAIAALTRTATEVCEAFVGGPLIVRELSETVPADGRWQRLATVPVVAIVAVEWIEVGGGTYPVPVGGHAVDIDATGVGRVRVSPPALAGRVRVTYRAGLASDWNGVPEAIRHGIVRLVAHLFVARDAPVGEPPAAVAALWRPWRRMRLS